MRKYFLLTTLTMMALQLASAQGFNNEPEFKRFGFKAGANFSHMNFSRSVNSAAANIETSWKTGITIGFLMAVPITDNLSLQPEYLYTQTGGTVKSTNTAYKFSYLSLPVSLRYTFNKFGISAGPQFDLLIDAKRSQNGTSTKITRDTEERSISFTGSIDYEVVPSFSICARYIYGFNNVGLGQRSNVQEFKYDMAQITACIRF